MGGEVLGFVQHTLDVGGGIEIEFYDCWRFCAGEACADYIVACALEGDEDLSTEKTGCACYKSCFCHVVFVGGWRWASRCCRQKF